MNLSMSAATASLMGVSSNTLAVREIPVGKLLSPPDKLRVLLLVHNGRVCGDYFDSWYHLGLAEDIVRVDGFVEIHHKRVLVLPDGVHHEQGRTHARQQPPPEPEPGGRRRPSLKEDPSEETWRWRLGRRISQQLTVSISNAFLKQKSNLLDEQIVLLFRLQFQIVGFKTD